jgi:hypothetical protein
MGSDRARVTYDPRQQYRSVVMQQGRVTLEADWNEAQQITEEEIRREALDIVGSCGTPDDGYRVVLPTSPVTPPYDFSVTDGTMYVGGLRAHVYESVQYSNQQDWRDYSSDPDWVDPSNTPPPNEFVYLFLREQEVSAVEDSDLKDIALGGPDTAQRTRVLQRIVRVGCTGTDCTSGLFAAERNWQNEGLHFDAADMRLKSWGGLEVRFSNQAQEKNLCQPQAQGGYLAPDNQLIRVQITCNDPKKGLKFVWGFDDASFLYKVQVDPGNPQQLNLQTIPVDAEHQPASNQAVEVLPTAADLPNGGVVAATSGIVFTLNDNYDPDSQSIQVPTGVTLPTGYATPPEQLFLRVWQEEVTFDAGNAYPLGTTGVTVTLRTQNNHKFHIGDYWMFAVRPATPQTVYPERYQNGFQPPEGPRLWACPLGVISWSGTTGTLASDCRNQFTNLVNLSKRWQGCCTVTVRPQDLTGRTTLQSIVDSMGTLTMFVNAANEGAAGNDIAIEISNVQLNATPPVFDLTVTETNIYTDLAMSTIASTLGTTGLVNLPSAPTSTTLPVIQTATLTNGGPEANAQANVIDDSKNTLFVLQARNAGADGNITQATISNVDTTKNTFDLVVSWSKTLPGLSLATLLSSIKGSLGYEIIATPPATSAPAFPAAGVTVLTGGADASSPTGATAAQGQLFGSPAKLCLRPGSYLLSSPLIFLPAQSNITIEACGGPATLSVMAGQENNFLGGLIQINGAAGITLRGLVFDMPQINFYPAGGSLGGLSSANLFSMNEASLISLNTSVGILVIGCQKLTIEGCTFSFPSLQLNDVLFAVGILASGDSSGTILKGNSFQGPASVKTLSQTTGQDVSVALTGGFVQTPFVQLTGGSSGEAGSGEGTYLPSTLDNLSIIQNSFGDLTFPVAIGSTLGSVRIDQNVVTSCWTGFTLAPFTGLYVVGTQAVPKGADATSLATTRQILGNSALQRMMTIAAAYPRPVSLAPARKFTVAATAKPLIDLKPAPVHEAKTPATIIDTTSFHPLTAAAATLINQLPVSLFTEPQLLFRIQLNNNQVDALLAGGASGWALSIANWDLQEATTAGIGTLVGNQLRNSSSVFPTAFVAIDKSAATGNLVLNLLSSGDQGQASLVITNNLKNNSAKAAVTGNVFQGPPDLPEHPNAPAWKFLNELT